MNEQTTAALNALNKAKVTYNALLEEYLKKGALDRILSGLSGSLKTAKANLDHAEKAYMQQMGYSQLEGPGSSENSILPIVAVGVFGLVLVAIFIKFIKK